MPFLKIITKDPIFVLSILLLIIISMFVLNALSPQLFPSYYFYTIAAILVFVLFSKLDFRILSLFSFHIYAISILLLIITLVIGSVTRGTVRWIPLGPIRLQAGELVRPFLILFFANYLINGSLSFKKLIKALVLMVTPVFLILIQPSLSVSLLAAIGFIGVIFAMNFEKKYILVGLGLALILLPPFWLILRPYQKERILSFTNPWADPLGSGYNSIQSMIAVGSGKIYGRNLGEGVQTQLAFLPEKQTDFIFAAISEELGFIGAALTLIITFIILWRLTVFAENPVNPVARAYLSGLIFTLFIQIIIHVGMNLGLLPVAGLPYPLVSAGGSSLVSTMLGLGIALSGFER